uniref:Complement component c3b, tandem duplicate 1 n=1 Tax=Astyanax mexicanus TaxID=7994 RepID=W5L2G3_ASTMX
APAQLRVGSKENILVEALNVAQPITVSFTIYDYPGKSVLLWQGFVTLNAENSYGSLKTIEIDPILLRPEEKVEKYVELVTQFGTFHRREQVLKVSFLSGYIFIQTDKPVYNPGDTRYRAFVSNVGFQAFSGTISVEIQNPDGITVHAEVQSRAHEGIYSDTYALSDMVKSVLPAFNVTLTPLKHHLDLEDQEFVVKVSAYLYGEPVEGVAYVVFGVELNGNKIRLPTMKQVKDVLNEGSATLTMEELQRAYPNIQGLVGSSIYVKASVLTSSSDLVEAEKSGIKIVLASYELSFKGTPRIFKSGLPFALTLRVSHHDGSPAPNVPVKINLLSDPVTVHNGIIKTSLLTVGPAKGQDSDTYSPGDSFRFQIRGHPGAKVGLVAVDNAVFLLSKSRLTQSKIWDTVGRSDMGCTLRGVKNGMQMFVESGLTFESSYGDRCSANQRKKRSAARMNLRAQLKKYLEESQQRCCSAGMKEIPMPYSCRRRSLYITEDWMEEEEEEEEDEEDYASLDDIYVRTKFFESWLWTDIKLPGVPETGARDLASMPMVSALPDSITQWGILGISASRDTFCVAESFNLKAWKPFFIDLRLPRTTARNEHLEVKAVLHNYMNTELQVLVYLEKTEDICSVASTGRHVQQVIVKARSSVVLPYTIIPLKVGELPLQVTATARSFAGQDAIRKTLRVVLEGIQKLDVRSYVLNPADKGDGRQQIRVNRAELISVIPNSLPETFVNIRDLLADSIDNSINKDSLASLIQMPGGCVEQNLASIILPLIAAHYLDRSKQWESVGMQRREEAIKYVQAYEKQLHYRKSDDSYPPYRSEGSSTITAFVVKVFSMAKPFVGVDEQHICGPLVYLLKNKLLYSGAFKEDNPVFSSTLSGGLRGAESKETLTAFVLIALAEAQNAVTCSNAPVNTERKSGEYLKERFPRLKRPYSVAIACYALAVSGQGCMKSMLMKAASPQTHWPDSDNSFFTLEATGYALLALLKGGHMLEAIAPFKWLNEQRGYRGGYGTTQSTLVVLQALSEFLVKRPPEKQLSLQVELRVPGRSEMRWAFTPSLAHVARSSRLQVPLDQDFTVVASGNGQGVLEVVTAYNQLPVVHEKSNCNGFELDVSISESTKRPAEVEKSYSLNISVALGPRQVRMVILDISLPTGFEPEISDLELLQLSNSVDRYINNFQVVDNLSDRGSLIIHLFKVSSREADILTFRLQQKFKVGLLQPSTVTAYQYYNKKRCSVFYSPPEDKEQLSHICKDNTCRCTQDCCVVKAVGESSSVSDREKVVCTGIHHFKVRVLSVNTSQYDRYEMEILQVIKETEVGLKQQDTRVFLSHAGCREGLNLLQGQDYLIIGPPSDIWHAGSSSS